MGRHLFDNCILGTLKDKVKILVTHQLQFLKCADELLLINGGRVEAQGSYTELLKTGINFALLLRQDDGPKDLLDLEEANKLLKYKGTGMEVLTRAKSQPSFRRSASMSLLEMGTFDNPLVPEEFPWEEEPAIARSFGQNNYDSSSRRMFVTHTQILIV